jgi:hypothetical protein
VRRWIRHAAGQARTWHLSTKVHLHIRTSSAHDSIVLFVAMAVVVVAITLLFVDIVVLVVSDGG